ncbi:MAG: hypothetical protein AAGC55_06085, partial [Myxococcota bacterium]
AEDVVAVRPARPGSPHIAAVFGVEPAPGDHGRRDIHVVVSGSEPDIVFQADAPVGVLRCRTRDVLPFAPGLPLAGWRPVMGFARIAGEMVILLDIPSMIDNLLEYCAGGQS